VEAPARNDAAVQYAAAANNRPPTNIAAAAQNAFRTHHQPDKHARGRTNSSSRLQPEGRRPRDQYLPTSRQYHPTPARQAPPTNNQRKPPTSAPTWPGQRPPSRRSPSTSHFHKPRPNRNAVPLSLASHYSRGPSHSSRREPQAPSVPRRASTATEPFERATTRTFPQNQRFGPSEPRRGSSSSSSGRPEDLREGNTSLVARGQVAAQRRDGSAGGGAEEHTFETGQESRSPEPEEVDDRREPAYEVDGNSPRTSPTPGFEARSTSPRSRSESPRGEAQSESPSPRDRSSSRRSDGASVVGSEERGQGEKERGQDEGRWPGSEGMGMIMRKGGYRGVVLHRRGESAFRRGIALSRRGESLGVNLRHVGVMVLRQRGVERGGRMSRRRSRNQGLRMRAIGRALSSREMRK